MYILHAVYFPCNQPFEDLNACMMAGRTVDGFFYVSVEHKAYNLCISRRTIHEKGFGELVIKFYRNTWTNSGFIRRLFFSTCRMKSPFLLG